MCSIIRRYVFDVVRAVVPKIDLDNVFIAKEEIAQDVQATLTKVRCVGIFLFYFFGRWLLPYFVSTLYLLVLVST